MQVWAQRKRPIEDTESSSAAQAASRSAADVWALRVLDGIHAGAERKLQDHGMLMVGSSDDCDIIFSDAGVAAHHCIISRSQEMLSLRAVDADVKVDDRVLHPGEPHTIAAFSVLQVGGACFALGPHWSDRWQTLLTRVAVAAPSAERKDSIPPRSGSRIATLGVAAVLLIASTGALVLAQHNAKAPPPPPPAAARDGELRGLVETMGYRGLSVAMAKDGKLVVTGYVEGREDLAKLRSALEQRAFNAEIEAKSGARIADDVAESFRMSSLHAITEWKGAGHVLVRGHFGDEKEMKAFLASRTMRDFNENLNLKLDVMNLDPVQAEVNTVPEGKRIRQIVDGADPYLVSADKSTYYAGARLPQGGTFLGIENGEVLVRDDTDNVQHLPRDRVVDASSP